MPHYTACRRVSAACGERPVLFYIIALLSAPRRPLHLITAFDMLITTPNVRVMAMRQFSAPAQSWSKIARRPPLKRRRCAGAL
ncbi:hypothetical protein EVAR_53601_1 [Eumeta japonica]|uniref:Uncharacterized protein n=1 Tax=Eumeta variegata TaxID=151549 RepID=A0A4C1X0A4_EUMVA|nr:hypothetical protein EVAR_53601_1 [Eumeta japonica]